MGLLGADISGRDVADQPFSVGDRHQSGLKVHVTSRLAELGGTVSDGTVGLPHVPVAIFAVDPERWRPNSRFVHVLRSDRSGQFRARGFPAGDYVVAAVLDGELGDFYDSEVLQLLASQAQRIMLTPEQPQKMELKPVLLP